MEVESDESGRALQAASEGSPWFRPITFPGWLGWIVTGLVIIWAGWDFMERRARLREQWSDPARPAIQSLEGTSRLKEVGVDVHALNRLLGSVPGNNESPIAAAALNLQGNVLTGDGMEMEAIPLYEKALALLSKRLGAGHPDVKVVEENLRECRRRMDTPASR